MPETNPRIVSEPDPSETTLRSGPVSDSDDPLLQLTAALCYEIIQHGIYNQLVNV